MRRRNFIVLVASGTLASFVIGLLIGLYGIAKPKTDTELTTTSTTTACVVEPQTTTRSSIDNCSEEKESADLLKALMVDQYNTESIQEILDIVNATRIREFSRRLTKVPHLAGTVVERELVGWIKQNWEQSGLDEVKLADYDFYLSWPNHSNPNAVQLIDADNNIQFTSQYREKELLAGDDHRDLVLAYHAFSPAATVEGDLVYVNFGRNEDFQKLEELLGEDFLKDKICMARYGQNPLGEKVKLCQDYGSKGAILYSDPSETAFEGTEPDKVYPNTTFLPGSGIRRGSVYLGAGDPLSQGWPSVKNAYRQDLSNANGFPTIPSQPIGYDDAKVLLEKLGGPDHPSDEWKGGLDVEYKVGGQFKETGWKVKICTHNFAETVKGSNVIGVIRGSVEPDRYVILGTHHDALGHGAVEPSSGTAQLTEVAAVLGQKKAEGWRPRRTIILASWAAHDPGLMGSYEWVHQHLPTLQQRTVAVVNPNFCAAGPIPVPSFSPSLKQVVIEALKHSSLQEFMSDIDYKKIWLNEDQEDINFSDLNFGSDIEPFAFLAGIPGIAIEFKQNVSQDKYPTYHTGYDTFNLVDNLIDPGFRIHQACAKFSIDTVLHLADSALLPFNLQLIPQAMKQSLDEFDGQNVTNILEANGVSLKFVREAINDLTEASSNFMVMVKNDADLQKNPVKLRMINDKMMQIERMFLLDRGIPEQPGVRNAIFAPAKHPIINSTARFPSIQDLLFKIKTSSADLTLHWDTMKRHVSDLMIMIQSATNLLQ